MFLVSSLTIVILFVFSLIMPVMSFALPVYKIKKMKNFTFRQKIIANLIAMIVIGIIDPMLLILYIGFFITIEVAYYYFKKIKYSIKKFDRMILTTILITIFMSMLILFLKEDINKNIQLLMEIYEKNLDLTKVESLEIFNGIKESIIFYIFTYSMLCVFLTYVSLDVLDYENWEISFEWLLLYIIPYFLIKIWKIENFYILNIMDIGEIIFIFFGIKTIYKFLGENIKYKAINNMLAIISALLFPFGTFIIGVLGGFQNKK